jgi:hypothetical protein
MSEINAIATNNYILHNIDAKKLYVQEPLFTANSGDAVYVGWRPDETVLWSGTSAGTILSAETTLAESMKNFERIRFYFGSDYNQGQVIEQNCPVGSNNYFNFALPGGGANCWMQYSKWSADGDFTKIKMQYCKAINYGSFGGTGTVTLTATTANDLSKVQKIVGINRKENA